MEDNKNKIYHLYLNSFLAWVTNGRFILGENISSIGIKPLADRILTRHKVTKVWNIYSFPFEFEHELLDKIFVDMRGRYPDVQLVFQLVNTPINLNTEDQLFLSGRKRAADAYEKFKAAFQSLNETDQIAGVKYLTPAGIRLSFDKSDVKKKEQEWESYVIAAGI